jgi:hypothetical protein
MPVYHWIANSFAAPFFSETDAGFVEGIDARSALDKAVSQYNHPAGLFAMMIETCEPKPRMVARFTSGRAATQRLCDLSDGKGGYWKDGKKLELQKDVTEVWKE